MIQTRHPFNALFQGRGRSLSIHLAESQSLTFCGKQLSPIVWRLMGWGVCVFVIHEKTSGVTRKLQTNLNGFFACKIKLIIRTMFGHSQQKSIFTNYKIWLVKITKYFFRRHYLFKSTIRQKKRQINWFVVPTVFNYVELHIMWDRISSRVVCGNKFLWFNGGVCFGRINSLFITFFYFHFLLLLELIVSEKTFQYSKYTCSLGVTGKLMGAYTVCPIE